MRRRLERGKSAIEVDIAIVGTGPGGLYAAWRLLQHPRYESQRICLFDAADRVGGRVLSVTIPEFPYVTELGAMRYVSDQILLASLVRELELPSTRFKCDPRGYFLRGEFVETADFKQRENPLVSRLYRLEEDEKGKDPSELIIMAIQRALCDTRIQGAADKEEAKEVSIAELHRKLKELSRTDPSFTLVKGDVEKNIKPFFCAKEWRLIKRFGFIDDESLRHYGFWDLVQRYLSMEGYNLAHDGSGYQSILSMWNAADAIVWYLADFANVPYLTIKGGMGKLIDTLHANVLELAKDRPQYRDTMICNLRWNLKKISLDQSLKEKAFRLGFSVNEFFPDSLQSENSVIARKVILALPQPALKNLDLKKLQVTLKSGGENIPFVRLLDGVAANPLCKIFAVFEAPWWEQKDTQENDVPSSFKVFTDLPLRMLYLFGKAHQCVPTRHDRTGSCLLLAYSDSRYAEYWDRLDSMCANDQSHYNESFRASMSPKEWDDFSQNTLELYGTGDAFMARVKEQLTKVTGYDVPIPGTVLLKHWSKPPAYVGWHSWNMGFKSWQIAAKMVQPFGSDISLFTCGEAFSSEQGWIEGALKSTERVLETLGLATPQWVDQSEYQEQKILWL
jgi:hypothetical protein